MSDTSNKTAATAVPSAAAAQPVEDLSSDVTSRGVRQPNFPWIMSLGLLFAPIAWFAAPSAGRNTLLPVIFSNIDPAGKVWAVGTVAAVATVTAAIANYLFGALSDVTRSRFGKRTPWIVGGCVVMIAALIWVANSTTVWMVIVAWAVVAAAENAMMAAIVAQFSDRVAPKWRGRLSAGYAIGFVIAQNFALVGAQFLDRPKLGIYVLAAIAGVATIIHVLCLREPSNLDEPRVKFDAQKFLQYFSLPTKNARDYYLAVAGKFMMTTGATMVTSYQLFIFTDYFGLAEADAKGPISVMSAITMVLGAVFALAGGLLADHLHRVKLPVALSTALVGAGVLFPFFWQDPVSMFFYAAAIGIGNGLYNSVDNALNVAVLPNPDNAGKDLGVINLANTLSQALAGLVGGAVITAFSITLADGTIDAAAGYHALFPIAFGINLVGAILFMLIRKVK